MFAVIEIAGKQFTAREQENLKVPFLPNTVGDSVIFDRVLLIDKKGKTTIGKPTVAKAKVTATVIERGSDDKIVVFKKKRRKDYKKMKGHRQDFSVVRIDSIKTS
ncbi:50S ribosomal protein L21 [candidate division KSB1 bacterium]